MLRHYATRALLAHKCTLGRFHIHMWLLPTIKRKQRQHLEKMNDTESQWPRSWFAARLRGEYSLFSYKCRYSATLRITNRSCVSIGSKQLYFGALLPSDPITPTSRSQPPSGAVVWAEIAVARAEARRSWRRTGCFLIRYLSISFIFHKATRGPRLIAGRRWASR